MALYRRYRPQRFQDVIGQEHVTRPIMAALRAGRTAHAYLFSGPRGCGKTTSARILARCLDCAQAPTDTPCGECESCRELSLTGGGSLDVVEMDAASHGGVDDARELIERAAFAPARDRYKIFIIDEAHMVSNQGFNALLKLVEEPPAHVKFVFATTEPEKVIGTIRSRTHHYPFRLVPPDTLETFMSGICAEEGIEIGAGVLPLVVRAGGGSVRDSLSVLDQLIGGAEGSVLAYDQAIALLGFTDGSLLDDAVEAVAARDGATLFAVVERVVQSGHDPRRFVEDLLQRLRDLIVVSLAGERAGDVLASVPEDQYGRMIAQAEHLGARGASRAADLTNDALSGMVGATSPRLQLELLCARLLIPEPSPVETGREHAAGGGPDEPGPATPAPRAGAPGVRPASARRQTVPPRKGDPVAAGRKISPAWAASDGPHDDRRQDGKPSRPKQGGIPPGRTPEAVASPAAGGDSTTSAQAGRPAPGTADASMVRQRWGEIVEAVARTSKSSAALIEGHAMVGAIRDGLLHLHFQTAGLATTFNDRGHSSRVAAALHDVLGIDVRVRGLVGGGEVDPKVPAAHDRAARRGESAAGVRDGAAGTRAADRGRDGTGETPTPGSRSSGHPDAPPGGGRSTVGGPRFDGHPEPVELDDDPYEMDGNGSRDHAPRSRTSGRDGASRMPDAPEPPAKGEDPAGVLAQLIDPPRHSDAETVDGPAPTPPDERNADPSGETPDPEDRETAGDPRTRGRADGPATTDGQTSDDVPFYKQQMPKLASQSSPSPRRSPASRPPQSGNSRQASSSSRPAEPSQPRRPRESPPEASASARTVAMSPDGGQASPGGGETPSDGKEEARGGAESTDAARPAGMPPKPGAPGDGGRPRAGEAAGKMSIADRIRAVHGGDPSRQNRASRQGEPTAGDSDEEEVSPSDPTISQSDLVGLDVVISTFDGTVIEEIPRDRGGQ